MMLLLFLKFSSIIPALPLNTFNTLNDDKALKALEALGLSRRGHQQSDFSLIINPPLYTKMSIV